LPKATEAKDGLGNWSFNTILETITTTAYYENFEKL
jgi:hypothetical protein